MVVPQRPQSSTVPAIRVTSPAFFVRVSLIFQSPSLDFFFFVPRAVSPRRGPAAVAARWRAGVPVVVPERPQSSTVPAVRVSSPRADLSG